MKLAMAVGIFLLAGIPGSAQAQAQSDSQSLIMAAPTQQPAESVDNSNASGDKDTARLVGQAKSATGFTSAVTKCAELIAESKNLAQITEFLQKSREFLRVLGNVLKSVSWGVNISTGNTAGMADDLQNTIISEGGCRAFGPVLCPAYKTGMTIGTILNYAPKLIYGDMNKPTIRDMWTDVVVDADFRSKETDAEVERLINRMIARHQQELPALRAPSSPPLPPRCSKLEQAKDAVSDILAKAKANAAAMPMTPSDSGLSAQTDAAINTGRANADSAIAAGTNQIMSTIRTMPQAQTAIQQSQPGGTATSTCGGAPFTPSPGRICYRGHECIGTERQCQCVMDNLPPGDPNCRGP